MSAWLQGHKNMSPIELSPINDLIERLNFRVRSSVLSMKSGRNQAAITIQNDATNGRIGSDRANSLATRCNCQTHRFDI